MILATEVNVDCCSLSGRDATILTRNVKAGREISLPRMAVSKTFVFVFVLLLLLVYAKDVCWRLIACSQLYR